MSNIQTIPHVYETISGGFQCNSSIGQSNMGKSASKTNNLFAAAKGNNSINRYCGNMPGNNPGDLPQAGGDCGVYVP